MSLLDRLRPKWQSANAEVRAEAVRELDKDEVELLVAVAQQDADPKVRRIAVKKLNSPRLLIEIAEKDADSQLRVFARKRARQFLVQIACDARDVEESKRALALLDEAVDRISVLERAHFPELRGAALESLTGEDDLLELVKRAKEPDVRARALERIQSPHVLKKVVFDETAGDLAFSAVSRIEDLETLETIHDQHALPKAVRRHALSKLEELVPPDHPIKVKARQERFLEVCLKAEFLAEARTTSELDSLRRSWSDLESEGPPDATLLERYRNALEQLETIAASARSREAPEALEETVPPSVEASTDDPRLVLILDRLSSLEDDALVSGIDTALVEWGEAAGDGTGPSPELESRLRIVVAAAKARRSEWTERQSLLGEASTVVERAEKASEDSDRSTAVRAFRTAEREWKRLTKTPLGAPDDLAERFRVAAQRVHSREVEARRELDETQQATLQVLEARIARMDSLSTREELSIKEADAEMREAQDFLKSMGPLPRSVNRKKARARLAEAREKLFKRAQDSRELDEWKRWANVEIQQSLIERIEKLQPSKDLPKVAKELRATQEEWKKAGAATAEKADELWNRYKSIRDELRARCDAFFEKQAVERTENLKSKELLCERVEALKDSEDWNGTAEAIKELQQQWKKSGPAPKASSEAIWIRFRAACDHFFERRNRIFDQAKSERDDNLAKKVALCERAEALRESTSWHETAEELKRLQSQWREIGAVPRKKSDEVWARFRAACDYFFDRFKRRDQVDNEEKVKRREDLVVEIETLGSSSEASSSVASRVQEIWAEWKNLGPTDVSRELGDRFARAVSAIVLANAQSLAGGELDPQASKKKRQKLCERLESVVEELDVEKPKAQPLEDLAQRLKDALASNTMTGGKRQQPKLNWRGASDEVARLRTNWLRSAPVPGDEGRALAERFDKALQSFEELRGN